MVQWIALAIIAALAAGGRKKGGISSEVFTAGVMQLLQGRAYHFEVSLTGLEKTGNAPVAAASVVAALKLAGAWDVIAAPTSPLLISYSMLTTTTRALSVGAPYPYEAQGLTGQATCTSVREVAPPAAAPLARR